MKVSINSPYLALPDGIEDPLLFCFLDNFLVDSGVTLGSRYVGQFQGWDCDDLGSLWEGGSVDQLFLYPEGNQACE